jgi:hypothetical protein
MFCWVTTKVSLCLPLLLVYLEACPLVLWLLIKTLGAIFYKLIALFHVPKCFIYANLLVVCIQSILSTSLLHSYLLHIRLMIICWYTIFSCCFIYANLLAVCIQSILSTILLHSYLLHIRLMIICWYNIFACCFIYANLLAVCIQSILSTSLLHSYLLHVPLMIICWYNIICLLLSIWSWRAS